MELFESEKKEASLFLKFILKRKWIISIFSLSGLVLGIIITFFIPPKYESFGIIFPPNANSGLNVMEDPRFGYGTDADQTMQLLESRPMMDTIVNMYNLVQHFNIDKSDRAWHQKLEKIYHKNVSITKTRFFSLVIKVKTKDPQLSADIVNSMISLVDEMRTQLLRTNQQRVFDYYKSLYENQQKKVDSLKTLIYSINNPVQPNEFLYNHTESKSKLISNNNSPIVDSKEMENLILKYDFEFQTLNQLKRDYESAVLLIQKPLSKVYVVNKGLPNFKKASPSFLINGIIGFFLGMLFITGLLLILSMRNELKNTI